MKMMNKIFAASILGVAVLSQSVGADFLDDCLQGTFGVWGQATYFKPTHGGQTYATQSVLTQVGTPNPGAIKSRSVCPRYEWGFEAGALYLTRCDCFYAKIFGGWTEFTDHSAAIGFLAPNLPILPLLPTAVLEETGSVKADLLGEYWYIDGRVGHFLMRGCGSDVHAFLGVRYINLLERLAVKFDGIDPNTTFLQIVAQRQRSEFDGAGPQVGIGGQFCVWGDFGISGELGMMAIIGSRKNRARSFQFILGTAANSNEFQYDSCVAVIPGIDFQGGVNWSTEWSCIKGGVEIGYKLHHYFNAFNLAITPGNTTILRDVGFAGPYIGVGIAY